MRTILVTGASGGIGREICVVLAEEARTAQTSLRVALHGSRNSQALDDLASELEGNGIEARAFSADLTDADAVASLVADVTAWSGRLDCLVSNAGQSGPGRLAELSLEQWQQTLDLNLRATWLLARAAYTALSESQGNIVAVASMSGLQPHPGYGAYSTAKAGLVMLCRQLALEWAEQGIRVNAVCPGMIRTPLTELVYQDEATHQQRQALVPLGRIGQPRDVANAVTFLASEKASYITGVSLLVDGGISDRMLELIPGRPSKLAPT